MKKRVISIFLSALVIFLTFAAVSTSAAAENAAVSVDQLPDSVDLRNYNGMNYVTPIKCQNPYGTCWAFATCAAAEISYLYQNGLGVPAGEYNNLADFSEKYLAWYTYGMLTDADVTPGRVRASQVGEGYDNSVPEENNPNAVYNYGGALSTAFALFASGLGPVEEDVEVNGEYPYYYAGKNRWRMMDNDDSQEEADARKEYFKEYYRQYIDLLVERGDIDSAEEYDAFFEGDWDAEGFLYVAAHYPYSYYAPFDDWTFPADPAYRFAPTAATLKSAYLLPTPSGKDEDGNYVFHQEGLDAIKTEIANGRGVCVSFYADQSLPGDEIGDEGYMNTVNWAQYTNEFIDTDHAVTIVGYDDNYPKENFSRTVNHEYVEGSTPPGDGAFIVKNSWGALTEEDKATVTYDPEGNPIYVNPNADTWGLEDSGYFYLSYYDYNYKAPVSYEFYTREESPKYAAYNYDQYDMVFYGDYYKAIRDNVTRTANVFDAPEDEYLCQISYVTVDSGANVHYAVYKNPDQGNPASGTLLEEGETQRDLAGFYRVDLKRKYYLEQGDTYSVVITETLSGDDGIERYKESFFYTNDTLKGAIANCVVNPGESYCYIDGEWSDLTQHKDELAELVYREDVEAYGEDYILSAIPNGAEGYKADNYPIKAYLQPADEYMEIIGDADRDGEVTIVDATAIQRYLAGIQVSVFSKTAADADGDESVTIFDATCIQRHLVGLPSPDSRLEFDALYARAVQDAMNADEDEIMPLVNINSDDGSVIRSGDKVLMLFMHKYPDSYPTGKDITLEWGNVWCVSAGEAYQWIRQNGDGVTNWTNRLHQLLGMPVTKGYTTVTAVWVDADILYRPANVTDPNAAMQATYQPTGDEAFDTMYKAWYDDNVSWSYYQSAYPWTRLGYTYDWADNGTAYGLSEFLIFSGADATVEYTYSVDDFIAYAKTMS